MLYPSFTREIGLAEALYAEELDVSRYIWLHEPSMRDGKKPGSNTGGPKVFSIHVGLDSHMGGDTGAAAGCPPVRERVDDQTLPVMERIRMGVVDVLVSAGP